MVKSPQSHIKLRNEPRISANELARYMVAGEVGRKGIIKRAREVNTAVAVRYADVRSVLRNAACDPVNEKRILAAARALYEQKAEDSTFSDWTRDDCQKSIEVIDSFLRMRNKLAGFDFMPVPSQQPLLIIGGVKVSINCDILIHKDAKSKPLVGAALFRLTKPEDDETESAKSKREEMGMYAATLVHMQISTNIPTSRVPKADLCCSIDVQSGEIHSAPRSYKSRANNLETACEFIAAMWGKA